MSEVNDWLPPGTPEEKWPYYYERGLLGLMMIDPTAIEFAEGALNASSFAFAQHGLLFAELVRLRNEDFPDLSPAFVAVALEAAGTIGACGGHDYLAGLVSDKLAAPRVRDWLISKVAEEAARRGMAEDMAAALKRANDRRLPVGDILRDLEAAAVARQLTAAGQERPRTMADLVDELGDEWDAGPGAIRVVPSFSPRMNHYLNGGFRPGRMYTWGGYSGTGKTIILAECAVHAADWASKKPDERGIVLYYTYEMPDVELAERTISMVAPVEGRFDFEHGWSASDRVLADKGRSIVRNLPLLIRDQTQMSDNTVATLMSDARRISRLYGKRIEMIVVDYLGLLTAPKAGNGGRYETVTAITRDLKRLAIVLDTVVLTASQLNRQNEAENRCPGRTDFRDSASIIQDSDYVFGYWVPDWNDEEKINSEEGTVAAFKVIKGRKGATGRMVPLRLHLRRTLLAPPMNDPIAPFEASELDEYIFDFGGLCALDVELPSTDAPAKAKDDKPVIHRNERQELEAVRLTKVVEHLRRNGEGKISQNAIKLWTGKQQKSEWNGTWYDRGFQFAKAQGWLTVDEGDPESKVKSYSYDLGVRAHIATAQTWGSIQGLKLSPNEEAERQREEQALVDALKSLEGETPIGVDGDRPADIGGNNAADGEEGE